MLGITILPDRSFIKVESSLLLSFLVPNMGLMRGALKSSSLKVPNARRGEWGGGNLKLDQRYGKPWVRRKWVWSLTAVGIGLCCIGIKSKKMSGTSHFHRIHGVDAKKKPHITDHFPQKMLS